MKVEECFYEKRRQKNRSFISLPRLGSSLYIEALSMLKNQNFWWKKNCFNNIKRQAWWDSNLKYRYIFMSSNVLCFTIQSNREGEFWNVELSNCQTTYCASSEQKHIVVWDDDILKRCRRGINYKSIFFWKCFPSTLFLI